MFFFVEIYSHCDCNVDAFIFFVHRMLHFFVASEVTVLKGSEATTPTDKEG